MSEIKKLRDVCRMMDATGADKRQYILVRQCDLELLLDAYERDKILKNWFKKIVRAIKEEKVDEGKDCEEKPGYSECGEKDGNKSAAEGPENRKDDHGEGNEGEIEGPRIEENRTEGLS